MPLAKRYRYCIRLTSGETKARTNSQRGGVYDDHAALRRYLVDEELLSRTPDGTYWRSGGTVPVSGS